MLSFGQRLKIIRKEAQITQAELSEKLMVSVQAISKWECDNTMPDISQIVPLAAILGVSTDCLLGVGGDENADREKLYQAVNDIYSTEYGVYAKDRDSHNKCCTLYRNHIRKYPLDYDAKYRYANCICHSLYNAKRLSFSFSNEEEDAIYNEAVNHLTAVINFDRDTTRLLEAKQILVMVYLYRNEFQKAEAIAESLPLAGNVRAAMELEIYGKKGNGEKCLEISELACAESVQNYLWALGVRARKLSDFGNAKREEALAAWRDLIESAKLNYKIFDDLNIVTKWLYSALNYLSNYYISLSEFDKALDIVEELTEILILHYGELKAKGDTSLLEEFLDGLTEHLHRCYNLSFKTKDNIIANDPRFIICREILEEIQ